MMVMAIGSGSRVGLHSKTFVSCFVVFPGIPMKFSVSIFGCLHTGLNIEYPIDGEQSLEIGLADSVCGGLTHHAVLRHILTLARRLSALRVCCLSGLKIGQGLTGLTPL